MSCASGDQDVAVQERVDHVVGREAFGGAGDRIDVDHDLPRLAAVGRGRRHALDGEQADADEVEAVVEELLLGEGLAGDGQLRDRNIGGENE